MTNHFVCGMRLIARWYKWYKWYRRNQRGVAIGIELEGGVMPTEAVLPLVKRL